MNQQVEERIELIDNFIFETTKGESKKWVHYFNGYVSVIVVILFFLFVEAITLGTFFHQFSNWAKADMITFFSLVFILQFPAHFINFLLFKHSQKIKSQQLLHSPESNNELLHLLQSIKKRFKPYWLKIPALLLMIIALTKSVYSNFLDKPSTILDTLWNYLPLPVFVIGFFLFGYASLQIWKIRVNLKAYEAQT